jgi:hypothetical protein
VAEPYADFVDAFNRFADQQNKSLEAILGRFADAQFEAAGLRPDRRVRPAMVAYTLAGANALGANATKGDSFPIAGSSPFVCTSIQCWSTGPFLVNLRPTTMPEDFGSAAGHSNGLFGPASAPIPLMLPRPWLLDQRATVRIDLTDLSAAANTIALILLGFRTDV